MFMDLLTFLGLDCFAYNIILCCPRNQFIKNQINRMIRSHKKVVKKVKKINMFKMDVRAF